MRGARRNSSGSRPRSVRRTRREQVETLIRIDRLLEEGLTRSDACDYVGISSSTLHRWQVQHGLCGTASQPVSDCAKTVL